MSMKRVVSETSPPAKYDGPAPTKPKETKGSKMNPKKKKRLDNYIKKKLAKEEKVDLMAKLAKSSFSSDLMQSSRSLGQGKMTTREKLRLAMNQQKAGIPISDPSVRLLVEKDVVEFQAAPQGKVQIISGNVSKPASNFSAIPLKAKKKTAMVSVKELLKRVRPVDLELSDNDDTGTDSSFDSSASEDEAPQVAEPKDLETAPTTSIEYLQAPTLPQPTPKAQPKAVVLHKRESGPTKFYVTVSRNEEIAASRMLLPVYGEEQDVMECLSQNDVMIICGETGSGKTTQVPQFLYEAGYGHPDSPNPGMVGITQPRRVAAVSMATRVSTELGDGGPFVSYQIRYDATTTKDTRIKFMTDGVLLREMALDFLLNRYSVIIIDEAHERTLNTDILIGALSRIIRLRNKFVREGKAGARPLKLVVMSATLRVKDFVGNQLLFPDIPPPVLEIKSRQHPVTVHFNKRTPEFDYVGEALKKVVKIHTRLPPGGILVFLTGQNEILDLCRRLNRRFQSQDVPKTQSRIQAGVDLETEDIMDHSEKPTDDLNGFDEDFGDSEEEVEEGQEVLPLSEEASEGPLYVLPLYAMLSTKQQLKVFEEIPEGHRLCVIATNVAETSLTIPNIRYVIDSGKAKEKNYDPHTQASSFAVNWTSQASADQRKGRAGRTGPGHCYRLYSSAVFNDQFEKFAQPEISRTPIEGVVLQMKSMNIDNVKNFPFPSPPPALSITKAEKHLTYLGAVTQEGQVSPVGQLMAMFPVAPRYAKMLAIGQQLNCMPYVIALVAALSVGDPFLKDYQINLEEEEDKPQKRKFYEALSKFTSRGHQSDLLRILMAVGAFEYSGGKDSFCHLHFLRPKAMDEIRKLRRQLTNLVQLFCPTVDVSLDPKLAPPTSEQANALRQILLAGFVDQVAVLKSLVDKEGTKGGYRPKGITGTPAYFTMWGEETVHIHPTSVLYLQDPPPPYVVYSQLSVTSAGVTLMQGVTAIEPKWLVSIAKPLVTFSKPLGSSKSIRARDKKGSVTLQPSFGPKSWPLPNHHVPISQFKK